MLYKIIKEFTVIKQTNNLTFYKILMLCKVYKNLEV